MGTNLESKKYNSTRYEVRKCLNCGEIFYCSKRKSSAGKTATFLRSRKAKTCSRKCSRIYLEKTNKVYYKEYYLRNKYNTRE